MRMIARRNVKGKKETSIGVLCIIEEGEGMEQRLARS